MLAGPPAGPHGKGGLFFAGITPECTRPGPLLSVAGLFWPMKKSHSWRGLGLRCCGATCSEAKDLLVLQVFETAAFNHSATSPPPLLHEVTGFPQAGGGSTPTTCRWERPFRPPDRPSPTWSPASLLDYSGNCCGLPSTSQRDDTGQERRRRSRSKRERPWRRSGHASRTSGTSL